jgi:hypothetical protein
MSEPLLITGRAKMSGVAFKKWLNCPISESANGARSLVPGHSTILDALVNFVQTICASSLGQNYLLCRYDKSAKELQFALCLVDASVDWLRQQADDLVEIIQCAPSIAHIELIDLGNAPDWWGHWIEDIPLLGSPETQVDWLDASIRINLFKSRDLSLASPENLVQIAWPFVTDGQDVIVTIPAIKDWVDSDGAEIKPEETFVLAGANHTTFRELCASFYSDGHWVWWCNFFGTQAPQNLGDCRTHLPKAHIMDPDWGSSFVTLGNTAWSEAYDDSKPPYERLHIKPLEIDGASFTRISKSHQFKDQYRSYCYTRLGLCEEVINLTPNE